NIAADHRHRRLEVMDNARQQSTDRGQTLTALTGFTGPEQAHGGGHVRAHHLEQRRVLIAELSAILFAEQAHGPKRPTVPFQLNADRVLDGEREEALYAFAEIDVVL